MVIIYYDIFYEMKQYVALYPEKLEDLTLNDLRDGCKGGNENGNVDDSGIICGNYRSVLP